jgi:peptidoglycan/xylan/chitin deacetylase (PgdA/CDA1 family)
MDWPAGKKAAIALTYDDALHSQLKFAVPQLNERHLHGTFFLDVDITPDDMLRWREIAANGHELGNHSLFHPCPRAMLTGREHYAVENYTPENMVAEIAAMNNVLFGIDGKRERTYSVPCSQTFVGGIDYTDALRRSGLIKYVRTGGDQFNAVLANPEKVDVFRIPSWGPVDSPDGPRLIAFVKRVMDVNGVGVFQFHGVGGDYLRVSAQAHKELLDYLQQHPEVWVVRFQDLFDYVQAHGAPREVQ